MTAQNQISPWRETAAGVEIFIRLTPRGGRDALDGAEILSDGRAILKARVRAAPQDGEANAALIRLIAKQLRIAPSALRLAAGAASRIKTIRIDGAPADLIAALERFCAPNKD